VTSLPELIPHRAIAGTALQQEPRFEKAHASPPFINILKICKKHWIEDNIAMKLMTF